MKNITVLGCGMIGSTIALDLATEFKITSIDMNKDALAFVEQNENVDIIYGDVGGDEAMASIRKSDYNNLDLDEEVLGSDEKKANASEIEIAKLVR
ncbi:MAG: NAD-binding protein, partial [Bacteroidetes bacterium]|nr:NAD-binding protein [Bacteroidota bacterium]